MKPRILRLNNYDDIQREITSVTMGCTRVAETALRMISRGKYSSKMSDYIPALLDSIKEYEEYSIRVNNLALSLVSGDLMSDGAKWNSFSRKIKDLRFKVDCGQSNVQNYINGIARLAADKRKLCFPQWSDLLTASVKCDSVKKYWTYAIDPVSLKTNPTYQLYIRIDFRKAHRMVSKFDACDLSIQQRKAEPKPSKSNYYDSPNLVGKQKGTEFDIIESLPFIYDESVEDSPLNLMKLNCSLWIQQNKPIKSRSVDCLYTSSLYSLMPNLATYTEVFKSSTVWSSAKCVADDYGFVLSDTFYENMRYSYGDRRFKFVKSS